MPYLIVDCNNFFVSCERVFNARLVGRPTVVLSNNDGCVISRSQEAKDLGIAMGAPAFQIDAKLRQHNVAALSANFALYGDLSQRVMEILASFTDDMEIYSIDEAFLRIVDRRPGPMAALTAEMQRRVQRWTGIPISVGVAETKTLAKVANSLVKKLPDGQRALYLDSPSVVDQTLSGLPVEHIWGIGRQSGLILRSYGIRSALSLKQAEERIVRKRLGVTGLRTQMELRGVPCLMLDGSASRKMVLCSRSFGRPIARLGELREAVALYMTRAAEKLRRQGSAARMVQVFLRTDRHRADEPQTSGAYTLTLPVASNYTPELVAVAHAALERCFCAGYYYLKAGVLLLDLCPENAVQLNLFDVSLTDGERERRRGLMLAMDTLNRNLGEGTVFLASAGIVQNRTWYSRQQHRSNRFTTRWDELFTVGDTECDREGEIDVWGNRGNRRARGVHHARPIAEDHGSRR